MNLVVFIGIALIFGSVPPTLSYGVNGGVQCAACTIVSGIFGQVAEIHSTDILNISLNICDHLFGPSTNNACRKAVQILEPLLFLLIELQGKVTPDTLCYALNICHQDHGEKVCHLFPVPSNNLLQSEIELVKIKVKPILEGWYGTDDHSKGKNICELPGVRDLCAYLSTIWDGMEPAYDFDGDKFSSSEKWRGSHWRGRDCFDVNSDIYPGRRPYYADVNFDANCNGIWGLDKEAGIPWETKFCAASKSRGIVMFGDSVGAHFHFPSAWFNPALISKDAIFKNPTGVLLDEFDWPQYSFSTGFKNITDPELIQGHVDSIYLRMRKRNLCNHRDYQNVCRNGATSFDLVKNVKNIARSFNDKPLTILLGVFGNDVCNRFPDTLKNMTSTKQFYKNIMQVIQSLEKTLPAKSHIALIGLVNGSFIYDTLSERLHPIGEYHGNVRYKDVFKWFECMQISPCNGWLSENKSIRDATTKRAVELSHVMKYIATSYISKNISLSYVPNPLTQVINNWAKKGGEVWQLFEPIDGFHPNQVAQPIIADILWKTLKSTAPESIGPINPHNKEILKMFGDQGGH
ncbi:Acyloxyacyl hydrolase [Frankliniella fusca]|uniref:Acyloxyacyl hydrolase n=1 Tax=Frankliniella fusca TaxID=407009 RepID=A0AAE1LDK3_9NEOP|nr:Acyloxyacyl hydrolase [Frankliniella fusca]